MDHGGAGGAATGGAVTRGSGGGIGGWINRQWRAGPVACPIRPSWWDACRVPWRGSATAIRTPVQRHVVRTICTGETRKAQQCHVKKCWYSGRHCNRTDAHQTNLYVE